MTGGSPVYRGRNRDLPRLSGLRLGDRDRQHAVVVRGRDLRPLDVLRETQRPGERTVRPLRKEDPALPVLRGGDRRAVVRGGGRAARPRVPHPRRGRLGPADQRRPAGAGGDGVRTARGGGSELAEEVGVPLLAQIPLVPAVREGADAGQPVKMAAPGTEADAAFDLLAAQVVERKPRIRSHPQLVIK